MFLENNTPGKLADNSEILSVKSGVNNISILEEDLALSSSTLASLQLVEKTSEDSDQLESVQYKVPNKVIYLNEETMDCNYSESAGTPNIKKATTVVSSPEMFNSDEDEEPDDEILDNLNTKRSTFNRILSQPLKNLLSPRKPSQEEMIIKSDSYLMKKMSKYLSGVPPPPKHTICQKDCHDLLSLIRENKSYFWIDAPFSDEKPNDGDKKPEKNEKETIKTTVIPSNDRNTGRGMRNLKDAFDACDGSSSCPGSSTADGITTDTNNTISEAVNSIGSETASVPLETKRVTFDVPEEEHLAIFQTIDASHAKDLPWSLAYEHKAPGIHYNRNKYVEEFENSTVSLCERYIGNETQSTCSLLTDRQAPNSARKRSLLARRNGDKSPGKRLSYLARRRRTFSSANLQGMSEKRQFVVNVKKLGGKKGKSPRGKSPRGKSPRSSAKKRIMRRLSIDTASPRKSKLETSKRALFQSPPNDRAGPSCSSISQNSSQKIKRELFSTIDKKNDAADNQDAVAAKKRKSSDELEGPRPKWAKSLSFDCPHNLDKTQESQSERYSTGNLKAQSQPTTNEMTDTNRKKLLWAVSQALRSRKISMTHPKFKQYATQLAKIVKKFMPDLENHSLPKKPGSTTERMLKHAKNHVILVVDAET